MQSAIQAPSQRLFSQQKGKEKGASDSPFISYTCVGFRKMTINTNFFRLNCESTSFELSLRITGGKAKKQIYDTRTAKSN